MTAVKPARGILILGGACLLLSACVQPPYGYYDQGLPSRYPPSSPGAGYQPYPLPPPVPPSSLPEQQLYNAPPSGYRAYEGAPDYRSGAGQFRTQPEYSPPVGPGYGAPSAGWPEQGRPEYGRDQVPQYRTQDDMFYGQPRRNRLDDPEPTSLPPYRRDEPPAEPMQPEGGSSGLGRPTWR